MRPRPVPPPRCRRPQTAPFSLPPVAGPQRPRATTLCGAPISPFAIGAAPPPWAQGIRVPRSWQAPMNAVCYRRHLPRRRRQPTDFAVCHRRRLPFLRNRDRNFRWRFRCPGGAVFSVWSRLGPSDARHGRDLGPSRCAEPGRSDRCFQYAMPEGLFLAELRIKEANSVSICRVVAREVLPSSCSRCGSGREPFLPLRNRVIIGQSRGWRRTCALLIIDKRFTAPGRYPPTAFRVG
jgi:hypothetical protein